MWTGPFASGNADVTVVLLNFFYIVSCDFIVFSFVMCKDSDFSFFFLVRKNIFVFKLNEN